MLRKHKKISNSKYNRSGQQMVEYVLLFVVVVIVMFAAVQPGGILTKVMNKTLETTMKGVEGNVKGSICFSDSVPASWDTSAPWKPACGPGVDMQTREIDCPSGCCTMPIPPTVRDCP